MAAWEVVIGIETHAQLSTASKIFSGASTAFGAAPNTQASAVDIALPGVLPVLNKGAVERAIRFGLAVGGKINGRSVFARKNYFYPDLPKGYQISQYEIPIVEGGEVPIVSPTRGELRVRLTRAHLEEDAGKSLHEDFQGMTGIDLNRAGTPLLEIVSEPDLRSADEAVAYAKALHGLVRWIGICDGNMQEGSFRCDANVSVRHAGETRLGTRCEIKNLNSFRFLERAIEYEVRRQVGLIEDGGTVVQETRLYDPDRDETRPMRTKEDAQDYRYFPDPDLPPLAIEPAWIERVRASLPELPAAMKIRFETQYALPAHEATMLTASRDLAAYFEDACGRSFAAMRSSSRTGSSAKCRPRCNRADHRHRRRAGAARRACRAACAHRRRHDLLEDRQGRFRCNVVGRRRTRHHHREQGLEADLRRRRDREGRRRSHRDESRDRRRVPRRQGEGVQRARRQGDGRDEGQGESRAGQPRAQAQAGTLKRIGLRAAGRVVLAVSLALAACAQPDLPRPPVAPEPTAQLPAQPPAESSPRDPSVERGRVSLYSHEFAGRPTASGERFDPEALTMAHRTLPFGTRVRVTNLENRQSVEVVVNDRGPFIRGRIADLSLAAARRIGMIADGVVDAMLEIVAPAKAR